MQHRRPLSLLGVGTIMNGLVAALAVSVLVVGLFVVAAAPAAQAVRPSSDRLAAQELRRLVDHYRVVTWDFERAAGAKRTPTSFSYRRATNPGYLRWTVSIWTHRSTLARQHALETLHRRLAVALPKPPKPHSALRTRVDYARRLTESLRRIYPGKTSRSLASARPSAGAAALRLWQAKSATAAVAVSRHAVRQPRIAAWLAEDLRCIHRYEGDWDANTGNGYYGGLQMDIGFQRHYGADFMSRWGTADNWPSWAQLEASARAYASGRGFNPWPNTARACGLL